MHRSVCVDERQVAAQLNVKPATLRKWRFLGRGPKFLRVGRAVRYRITDIEAWLATRQRGGKTRGTR
ncbi:MAG: helix-turn-helix domain-containing protein [Acidobacteria bacterium]|nr:helix-turn-helix domain-containing protein [Acidobacteriota bacterium]